MAYELLNPLLKELGKFLKIENLHTDQSNSCLIKFDNGVSVQFELFDKGEFFLICSQIAEIPPGRYRERLFKEALISNSAPYPINGVFAFANNVNQLVLFLLLPLKDLNGEKIHDALVPFLEKAKLWQEAIDKGDVPIIKAETMAPNSGMFGLNP